jgi:hypothetical protein
MNGINPSGGPPVATADVVYPDGDGKPMAETGLDHRLAHTWTPV